MTLEGKKIKLSIVWTHKGDEQTTNDNAKLKMIMPRHAKAKPVNQSTGFPILGLCIIVTVYIQAN